MKKVLLLILISILVLSCDKQDTSPSQGKIFSKVESGSSGIDFANYLKENDSLNYFTYGYIYMGGGISAGDINNDGLIDLYFTGNMVPNKLYLNKGNMKFEDISEQAGVAGDNRWYTGVTMADVNNDGYLDIYCSVGGKFKPKNNVLYINNGDMTFTESAAQYGIDDVGNAVQSTFFDYDLDGDLDLYVANYPPTKFNAPNFFYKFKMGNPKDVETDKLFRNDGGHFTNVTDEAGLRSFGLTNSATIADLNEDGWPDIYVSNDFNVPDYLFINNGDGTFTNHIQDAVKQMAQFGMGVDIADFNNDLLPDIFQMDMTPNDNRRSKANMAGMNPGKFWSTVESGFGYQYMQNMLQMNNGNLKGSTPVFSNVSRVGGVATTDWSWGPLLADLDNDGWKDIFIANGTRREINNKDYFKMIEKKGIKKDKTLEMSLAIPSEKIDNFVFRNNGDLTFKRMNEEWGIVYKGFSNGSVYADLDNDGDLEIVINNIDDKASVFENHSSDRNNYLSLNFKGPDKNPFGIGVKVTVISDSLKQYQELFLTRGFQSSTAARMHFGLGDQKKTDQVKIVWPDKKQQILTNVNSNQFIKIDYKDAVEVTRSETKPEKMLFATVSDSLFNIHHKHTENSYDDFQDEVLLPHKTSSFGPGISVGDLNGDGLDDFVIGAASNYETGIYFQTSKGFVRKEFRTVQEDRLSEDMGSLIFDADGDGDNDIYVVSGGNEFDYDSEQLQDRLYVNDGKGNFTKSEKALPKMLTSGNRVQAFDYDKDGDLDLFVGGRLVPRNYPIPADSYLLENVSAKGKPAFKDVTSEKAPEFKDLGLVTEAVWTDIDQDGWTDLMVVGEWMPVTVFRNVEGSFENITKKINLDKSNGWWFSISQGDFDKDGDMDYIIGNNGLNYKYQASGDETFDIYVNDFDKNKHQDIVLSYYDEGTKYPLRGRSCSSDQIPAIKKKFKNYDEFSKATLEDVYTKKDLEKSLHYQIRSFASIYLENRNGEFITHKLPNLVQVSSINRILVQDFDHDSNLDVVVAGNLYGSEIETPRNDAGIGLYLKGDGKGNFEPVRAYESGLFIEGDTKDLATINIGGNEYIIAAKNDDYLQFIRVDK